jgi:hypothetical protein
VKADWPSLDGIELPSSETNSAIGSGRGARHLWKIVSRALGHPTPTGNYLPRWRGSSKGHSLGPFHYTLPGNPLNELNGSLLPLATPANSQLWPTNSGQLARVGIVINQFMPLFCKKTFQLWPKISDTSTLGQRAKCTIAGIEVGRAMDCIGRQHIGSRCAATVL